MKRVLNWQFAVDRILSKLKMPILGTYEDIFFSLLEW